MTCKKTIWTGRYKDEIGIFEIIVPACNKDEATNNIKKSIKAIKEGERRVTKKIGEEDLIYIKEQLKLSEEVGDFDYIRD